MKIYKSTSTAYSYSNKYGSRGIKYQQRRLTKLQAQSKVDNKVISNDEVDKVSEGQKIFNYVFSLWHYLSNVLYCFKLCILK